MSRRSPRSRRPTARGCRGCMNWLVVMLIASLVVLLGLYYDEFGLPSRVGNAISEGQLALESIQATRTANAEVKQEEYERAILAAINQERGARGIHILEWDAELHAIARAHSQDMAKHDYFEHINQSGQHPGQRAVAAGYQCGNPRWLWGIGENIYFGRESATQSWMASPGHRRAMLSTTFRKAAIGAQEGRLSGYGTGTYTTLLMC